MTPETKSRFSSRKFWVVQEGIGLSFILAMLGKLTPVWGTVISVCVGAYVGINGFIEGKRIAANGAPNPEDNP